MTTGVTIVARVDKLRAMKSLKRWLGKGWPILLAGGLLAALAFPHLASAYHLEAGGRALDDVDRLGDRALPALEHLLQAVEWHAGNAQAYRLLSRVYQAHGEWAAAVEALTYYTELRPHNPLGHVELAQLYEAVEAEMQSMEVVDLIAALPEASVEAPDVPLDTPFAQADEPAWRSYVAATTFSLPPDTGDRPTLFMHPPARVTYTLSLPAQPAVLRFGLGLDPQSHDWPGDGATFEVFVNGERVFLEHVDKAMALEGWHERMVDLGSWAGEEVALVLAVTPGPAADASGDWAGWGEPQVVDALLVELRAMYPEVQVAREWQLAGATGLGFMQYGREALEAERYQGALAWYKRATVLEPSLGDAWYSMGLVYERMEQWEDAVVAHSTAAQAGKLPRVGASLPYYRAGRILQWRIEPRRLGEALSAYESALEIGDFGTEQEAADCHYKRGEILNWMGAHYATYMAEYLKAIDLDPSHIPAYVALAQTYYAHYGDLERAEEWIHRAIEIDSQNMLPYYRLSEIYFETGQFDAAEMMCRQVLELDPASAEANRCREVNSFDRKESDSGFLDH
jgi:tetratricopeptide (TPR) repeat protein